MSDPALPIDGVIKHYAWGDPDFLPALLGRPELAGKPCAELWYGSHPGGSARIASGSGGFSGNALSWLIANDGERWLGPRLSRRGWRDLPFLAKILCAREPLSIQAHPSLEAARKGFAREESAGIPRDAPERNYRDPYHKPEIICPITPFLALCGFRDGAAIAVDLESLASRAHGIGAIAVRRCLGDLARKAREGDFRSLTERLLDLREDDPGGEIAASVARASRELSGVDGSSGVDRFAELGKAAAFFPGDPGALFFVVLALHELKPGQALFLPSGMLHAYVRGAGIEVMANSDNVLRGGLTRKHVDSGELLANLDSRTRVRPLGNPGDTGLSRFEPPASEFAVDRLSGESRVDFVSSDGPGIVICAEGSADIVWEEAGIAGSGSLRLEAGRAAFIPPSGSRLGIEARGTVFRIRVPESGGDIPGQEPVGLRTAIHPDKHNNRE